MNLYSVSGTFALIENNKPKLIGELNYSARNKDGRDINCAEIKFHFGTEHEDYFYFEEDVLIVSTVYEKREKYIQDCYNYCTIGFIALGMIHAFWINADALYLFIILNLIVGLVMLFLSAKKVWSAGNRAR